MVFKSKKWTKKARAASASRKRKAPSSIGSIYTNSRKSSIASMVQSVVNKNLETKTTVFSSPDGVEIFHNNFITLDSTLLATEQGVQSNESGSWSRIGDQLMLKGVSIKMMLEANERYTDITFRILVVKCAKGDTPTRATLFNGISGNKMIDTINRERYTVLAQKWVKLKNDGQSLLTGPSDPGAGNNTNTQLVSSRHTRIVKMWIPGNRFVRSTKIVYQNGTSQPKFFDYHCLVYAYSNYSTLQDVYYVARLNDYVKQIYFKDG